MSQFSETTRHLSYLGYPNVSTHDEYYTAQVTPGVGVAIAHMSRDTTMVQFFPWEGVWKESGAIPPTADGHERYACFITAKATSTDAQQGVLFSKWPFELIAGFDILLIKCLIEDTIKSLGAKSNDPHQRDAADPEAGAAVE